MPIASELTITSGTAIEMAETIFGSGIQVTDATFTGDAMSAGIYSGATTSIAGISPTDGGVILSTGNVADFTNGTGTTDTNMVANRSTNTAGVDGDAQLNTLSGQATFDGAILQATFIPDGDTITMQFVFSSEEYPEYVSQNVNDAFGVWVNGTFVPATITVAGSVAIDEVNAAKNENFYRSNTGDQFNTEMDGLTYVLSIKAPVVAGASNTIKIAIADGGDAVWDSNLLIMAESIQTVTLAMDDTINMTANSSRTFDILANDASTSGAPLTITQIMGQNIVAGQTITLTSGQQVRLNADGTITVFSNGTLGQENFSYTVTDGTNTDVGYVKLNTGAAAALDGIVSGTSGGDLIDASYTGDPDGDRIDNNDGTGVQGTTGNADLIYAGAGNDTILSGEGNDIVHAGSGDDSVNAGAGDDRVFLGDGNDTITASDGNDTVYGGVGNDSITDDLGNDVAYGDAGNDTIFGGAGNDSLFGGAGGDSLLGGAGNDSLDGGADADKFTGDAGDVIIGGETTTAGGADNDVLVVEAGSTVTYGGGNNEAGTITLASGGTLTFSEIENVVFAGPVDGTAGSDTMGTGYTDLNGDQIDGSDGLNDTIYGYGGDDSIDAGAGADRLFGGEGADTLAGGAGADTLSGGAGIDIADYSASGAGVVVDLTYNYVDGGDATGDQLGNDIDGVAGSTFNDTITGYDAESTLPGNIYTNVLYGAGGDDYLDGMAGNDSLYGGTGRDTIYGGAGADTMQGGDDADRLHGTGGDAVDGGSGGDDNDTLVANGVVSVVFAAADQESGTLTFADGSTLAFSEIEHLQLNGNPDGNVDGAETGELMGPGYVDANGDIIDANDAILPGNTPNEDWIFAGGGNDTVLAGVENDHVYAGAGEDTVEGGTGDDYLEGGSENDLVLGQEGNDFQRGDAGNDTVYGGIGDDSVYGGLNEDSVFGEDGNDYVFGGYGNDTVYGGAGHDTMTGSGDDDLVYGGDGDDSLEGSDGNDTIYGGAGADTILGAEDADTIHAGVGDFVDGGEAVTDGTDNDTLYLTDVAGVVYAPGFPENGVVTFNDGSTLQFFNIENLYLDGVLSSPPDMIVDGTGGDDVMDVGFVDAQGDIIDGSDGLPDTIYGYDGNDSISAGEGADRVDGGTGNDSIAAGKGDDTVTGGAGDDRLTGDLGDDSLSGGSGDDRFVAADGFGNDTVIGGESAEVTGDTLDLSQVSGDLTLDLSAGDAASGEDGTVSGTNGSVTFTEIEQVILGSGNDSVTGSQGDDRVTTGAGRDTVAGGAGNDAVTLGSDGEADLIRLGDGDGSDTLSGFDGPLTGPGGTLTGVDQVDVSAMTDAYGHPVNVNDVTVSDDGNGNARLTFPNGEALTLLGISPITAANPAWLVAIGIPPALAPDYIVEGTGGADLIDASYGADPEGDLVDAADNATGTNDDLILAGDGNDTVLAGQGDDTIEGEAGDDQIAGGAGDDSVFGGSGNDLVQGQDGNDTLWGDGDDDTLQGGANDDLIGGGTGNDVLDGGAGADYLTGNEGQDSIDGGNGQDTVYAGSEADTVDGGLGDDLIEGEAGADLLAGGEGNDQIYGGSEKDSLTGGLGDDTLGGGSGADSLSGNEDNDYIDGNAGADVIDGGSGDDTVYAGSENDAVAGGEGQDTLYGGAGDDVIDGGTGNDTIYGETGSDSIDGGDGHDLIDGSDAGGGGDDTLSGGAGDDTILGGAGNEADTIYGGDGNDEITAWGGTDDEDIYGGAGNDTITTGGGDFELVYGGDDRDSFVVTSDASMQLDGGDGGDDHDTLDLRALGKANTDVVYTSPDKEDGYVRILDASGVETGRIDFADIETVIPCFTPGTLVQTDAGPRRVETIGPGDRVLTRDNGWQEVRWAGRRDLGAAELDRASAFVPVHIAAGAMGPGLPRRAMMVSPQHRMLVSTARAEMLFGEAEVLVAAVHLVGRPGITRARVAQVSYIHLLFDQHEIILADGVWTESFQPGTATLDGMDAPQRAEVLALFPQLAWGALFPAARITLKAHEARVLLSA